ncbi:MAG: hypothetical protein ACJ8AO_21980 [Gemmatimonadaceae bacterium]
MSEATDTVRDLLAAHSASDYPEELAGGEEVDGVALVMLDADVAGLAAAFLGAGGTLRPDQWFTLRECAADARAVVPQLEGDAWVYFARLFVLARAMLKFAPAKDPE